MNYKGVIIAESLADKSVLTGVKILSTNTEPVTKKHKTPWLAQWTLHAVEVQEDQADIIAQKLSDSFELEHSAWYADFKNDKAHYIIFPNKIFKIDLQNPLAYKDARQYGISLGIPKYQVDFSPEDKKWDR